MPRLDVAAGVVLVVVLAAVVPAFGGADPVDRPERSLATDDVRLSAKVDRAINRPNGSVGAGLRAIRADHVSARGTTGAGVRVGVVGSGFDASGRVVGPHVAARRRFGVGTLPHRLTAHDTAVAAVVSETASSSDLYLASVGRTPTAEEYADAIAWLVAHDVSVVVDAGSYFPTVGGEGERIAGAADRAVDAGVVFVTSAGNYADRHWRGRGVSDGWVAFDEGVEANALAGGSPTRGRVSLRLRWATAADYDLYLYRRTPFGDDRVVAASTTRETGPERTVEAIDVAVPRGRYYVAVYAHRGVDAPGRVQLFAAYHSLGDTTPRGSMVAPATSDRTIAVGAADESGYRSYSSRDAAGRVDVSAPGRAWVSSIRPLSGTSAAAPYVAGTAALMQSRNADLSPREVETILERTAGNDTTVDALAAVDAASSADSMAVDEGGTTPEAATDTSSGVVAVDDAVDDAADPARNRTRPDSGAHRDDGPDGRRATSGERRTDSRADAPADEDSRERAANESRATEPGANTGETASGPSRRTSTPPA